MFICIIIRYCLSMCESFDEVTFNILFPPGKIKTTARWIRDFVTSHPDYKQDSVVPESINYDLLLKCSQISNGDVDAELLPTLMDTKTAHVIPSAVSKAEEKLNLKNPRNGTVSTELVT